MNKKEELKRRQERLSAIGKKPNDIEVVNPVTYNTNSNWQMYDWSWGVKGPISHKKFIREDQQDDLNTLDEMLTKLGINHLFKNHQAYSEEVEKMIGYTPSGKYHISVPVRDGDLSVIRGAVSFGRFEIMWPDHEIDRFSTEQELVDKILEIYPDLNLQSIYDKIDKLIE